MKTGYLGSLAYIELEQGGYRMRAVPALGGQVIALEKEGLEALSAPASQEALEEKSTSYGLPILFPPNRIDQGHFQTAARSYQFTINEPARNNSLHGFLHKRPWTLTEATEDRLQMEFTANEESDFYAEFPHAFRAVLTYQLGKDGLWQTVTIENQSDEPMPVGLGFHSAFRVDAETKVRISVGERILMSERMLPTGQVRPLNEEEARFRAEGLTPVAWSMDDHYTAKPIEEGGRPFHGAVIKRAKGCVYYEVDPFYQHWMIWNAGQKGDLICLEPQNWRVNAPNLVSEGMSSEEAGFCLLAPGETVQASARLWIENQ